MEHPNIGKMESRDLWEEATEVRDYPNEKLPFGPAGQMLRLSG